MGRAMMGTWRSLRRRRAMAAAEAAIANPLLDETAMKGAQGLLISITVAATSLSSRWTRLRRVSARRSIRTPTSFSVRPSTRSSRPHSGFGRRDRHRPHGRGRWRPLRRLSSVAPKPIVPPVRRRSGPAAADCSLQPAPQPQPVQQPLSSSRMSTTSPLAIAKPKWSANSTSCAHPGRRTADAAAAAAATAGRGPSVRRASFSQALLRRRRTGHAAGRRPAPRPVEMQAPVQPQSRHSPVRQEPTPVVRQQPSRTHAEGRGLSAVVKAKWITGRSRRLCIRRKGRGPMGLLNRITSSLGAA